MKIKDCIIRNLLKKLINIHFNFNQACYGLFAMVKVADFSRVLSNLINHAVESVIASHGDISIE